MLFINSEHRTSVRAIRASAACRRVTAFLRVMHDKAERFFLRVFAPLKFIALLGRAL